MPFCQCMQLIVNAGLIAGDSTRIGVQSDEPDQ